MKPKLRELLMALFTTSDRFRVFLADAGDYRAVVDAVHWDADKSSVFFEAVEELDSGGMVDGVLCDRLVAVRDRRAIEIRAVFVEFGVAVPDVVVTAEAVVPQPAPLVVQLDVKHRELFLGVMAQWIDDEPNAWRDALDTIAPGAPEIRTKSDSYGQAVLIINALELIEGDPAPLWLFIEQIVERFPVLDGVYQQLLQDELLRTRDESGVFETATIFDGEPFIDRAELRTVLPTLLLAGGPTTLLVNGPAKSGKSFTMDVLEHISKVRGDFHVVRIEKIADAVRPETLASQIVTEAGGQATELPSPEVEPATTKEERYDERLARWVVERVCGLRPGILCLVLDDVRAPDLITRTRDFLESMARISATRLDFRLIYLRYDDHIAGLDQKQIKVDRLPRPDEIDEVHITQFFVGIAREWGRTNDFTRDDFQRWAGEIVAAVPAGEQNRLARLGDHVRRRWLEQAGSFV